MSYKIIIALFLFLSFKPIDINKDALNAEVWLIKPESSLVVYGKTNVNSFTCLVPSFGQTDTLSYIKTNKNASLDIECVMSINLHRFNCKNKMMTKDLLKTLQANCHPNMIINFLNLSDQLSSITNNKLIVTSTEIELAGKKRKMMINLYGSECNSTSKQLKGKAQICFSDFGLEAPTKMAGTIKVKNQLEVEFTLHLERLDFQKI